MRSPPTRRRSSLVPPPTAKPGVYGAKPGRRAISFAPNVTPDSYDAPPSDGDDFDDVDNELALFPPSQEPSVPAKRRHKKRPADHVPRPPNAFMLFRADFVRQKHVPGSIETNHTSLSKIIGSLWRALPPSEKRVWEQRAKAEKQLHQKRYPNYKYKPVHSRGKAKVVKKEEVKERDDTDEERCEEIAQLLLDGNKGSKLADAVRKLDKKRRGSFSDASTSQIDVGDTWMRRRSSSVPLELTLPTSTLYLPRRPSSSSGVFSSTSFHPHQSEYLPPYPSHPSHHLPPVNTSLFNPDYLHSDVDASPFSHSAPPAFSNPFAYETTSPYDLPPSFSSADVSAAPSPAPSSEASLPPIYAPQPQHPLVMSDITPFLSTAQRLSISEGRFSFADLTDEQRMGLRESFSWAQNLDFEGQAQQQQVSEDSQFSYDQYAQTEAEYTEFSYGGRRYSLNPMDFEMLLQHAGQSHPAHNMGSGDGMGDGSSDTLGVSSDMRDMCIAPHDTVMTPGPNGMVMEY